MADAIRRLYFARHGITAWNRDARFQGHTDIPLDAAGVAQAQQLAARLVALSTPPQAVWTSDLIRARQTGQIIGDALRLDVRTSPLLRETMLGAWEGLNRAEIEARGEGDLLTRFQRDSYRHRPPESETLEAVQSRMRAALALILAEQERGDVVIVGHGGSLRLLLCDALDAPITSARHLWLDNASLSIVDELERDGQRVQRVMLLNDTSHLQPVDVSL